MLAQLTAETAAMSKVAHSPVSAAMTMNASPAASIWTPLASSAGAGWTERFVAYSVPRVQNTGDTMSARRPAGSSAADVAGRPGEDRDADQADDDARADERRHRLAVQGEAEDREPHRHEGDEQRGDAGRDRLLAPRDEPRPADEEHRADDRRVAEPGPAWAGRSGRGSRR